jgi:hypothetical protein
MEMDSLEVVNLSYSRHANRSVVAPILDEVGELSFGLENTYNRVTDGARRSVVLASFDGPATLG